MFAAAKYGLLRKMSYNKNDKKILYKNHKCFSIFLNNKKQQLHSKRQPQVLSFPEQHRDKGVYNMLTNTYIIVMVYFFVWSYMYFSPNSACIWGFLLCF